MKVDITGKNIEITAAIRDRIDARFEKLAKWQVPFINSLAVLSIAPSNCFKIEASVSTPNGKLFASTTDTDMYAAINETYHKLERQLNKSQHKSEARRASHCNKEALYQEEVVE
ncbi:ribosome-associated translation inhibitor RaiA [Vibrio sp. SS-MA-C1-2]|uniref:ribosome hibernation-promoting factor, HPF/YfiA family n=1 Tax=Vibrio sp. SS-MA-C1-2 TaxID=2908646 RepID=UPI001F2260F1|nr:ribosome-associated translation inhibitor RaiA [Vibrio sp. SS-MA-C1-2]UJF18938.1 ribosome-associated translation inhibitor RaiA [Vibrio sp. SS-MA-C1-2]